MHLSSIYTQDFRGGLRRCSHEVPLHDIYINPVTAGMQSPVMGFMLRAIIVVVVVVVVVACLLF